MLIDPIADWAGGPGDSKADVQWIDEQLRAFFEANEMDVSVEGVVRASKGLRI